MQVHSRVLIAGLILFYAFAWMFNLILYAGSMALFSQCAPGLLGGKRELIQFLTSFLSTIISVGVVMWTGWLASGGRWGFLFLVLYTLIAAVMETSAAHDGATDSHSKRGNLLGHLINVLLWGIVWFFW